MTSWGFHKFLKCIRVSNNCLCISFICIPVIIIEVPLVVDFFPIVKCCIVYNVYFPPIRVNQVHRVAGAVGVGRQVVILLTALPYRDPRGTNFVCTARDQSLSMLSSNE